MNAWITTSKLFKRRKRFSLRSPLSCKKLAPTTELICLSNFNSGSKITPRFFTFSRMLSSKRPEKVLHFVKGEKDQTTYLQSFFDSTVGNDFPSNTWCPLNKPAAQLFSTLIIILTVSSDYVTLKTGEICWKFSLAITGTNYIWIYI